MTVMYEESADVLFLTYHTADTSRKFEDITWCFLKSSDYCQRETFTTSRPLLAGVNGIRNLFDPKPPDIDQLHAD